MCTVIFIPRKSGYLLGMNRDEQRSRQRSHAPRQIRSKGATFLYPSEPGGGTWIGANDSKITFALVNWYSVQSKVPGKFSSRGLVIPSMLASKSGQEATATMRGMDLSKTNPFRLTGFFPEEKQVMEWRWNLKKLDAIRHEWTTQAWISSGYDEPKAQQIRDKVFRHYLQASASGTRRWLRRVHRSHLPERGPFSICMHREDAATVSYTEVELRGAKIFMRHHDGSLCTSMPLKEDILPIK